eukprot:snap_masked-scaffold_105-processed-gene-0.6-mRNA-1 protein AED:1.00 eAED:1.00 QI:0/0/0/0/1/1/2/0/72
MKTAFPLQEVSSSFGLSFALTKISDESLDILQEHLNFIGGWWHEINITFFNVVVCHLFQDIVNLFSCKIVAS